MRPISRPHPRPPALAAALALVLLSLAALAGCGGSGKSGTATTPAQPKTGPGSAAAIKLGSGAGTTVPGFTAGDWPVFGRDRDNTRYVPATQITKDNVSTLGQAWSQGMGAHQNLMEAFPLIIKGVMYVTTSSDEVIAYDAATGKVKWHYVPKVDFTHSQGVGGYGISVNRGVAYSNGRIYVLTFDDNLKAVSAATGEELWSSQVVNPKTHAYETMSPTAYDGKIYVGSSGSDDGVRGFVAAYDEHTGKQVWRFYTIPAKGHSWNKDGTHGGGTVYMAPTIDVATGTLYAGTSNPSPAIVGTGRPGANLYASSIIALDAQTGKLKWYRQEVPHDLWDYDAESPVFIYDTTIGGKRVHAVGEAGKNGQFFMLDAATGKDLFPPVAFVDEDHKPPTKKGTLECPGPLGGSQYAPVAFSPKVDAAFISGINFCFILKATGKKVNGESQFGGLRVIPQDRTPNGTFTAVDLSTGKWKWQRKIDSPLGGGAVVTSTNVVFTGDQKGRLYAMDAATGRTLGRWNLGLAISSAPVIYTVGGTEYVAVAIGGSGLTSSNNFGPVGARVTVLKLGGGPISKPAVRG